MRSFQILQGDALERLSQLESGSVQCAVTSPPYWNLRDYNMAGQFGLEPTPELYVARLVEIMREVRRVLRQDGTLWLNLGDSYFGANWRGSEAIGTKQATNRGANFSQHSLNPMAYRDLKHPFLKPKDLCMIPARAAIALQEDGWYIRQDLIWSKPNPMPESVEDRCTKSHEYIFLLTKSAKYFYDSEAIKEQSTQAGKLITLGEKSFSKGQANGLGIKPSGNGNAANYLVPSDRNKRSVWTVNTHPFSEAHFAVFPPKLIEPCILAGTSEKGCCAACGAPYERIVERNNPSKEFNTGSDERYATLNNMGGNHQTINGLHRNSNGKSKGVYSTAVSKGWQASCKHNSSIIPCTVLDPFCGSGTSGLVALRHNRNFIGIELNPEYVEMARNRITNDAPLFNEERVA